MQSSREVVLRNSGKAVFANLAGSVPLCALAVLDIIDRNFSLGYVTVVTPLVVALGLTAGYRQRTVLTEDSISIRWSRWRTIPWSDISAVTLEDSWPGRVIV